MPQETSGATTFAFAASNGGILGESAAERQRDRRPVWPAPQRCQESRRSPTRPDGDSGGPLVQLLVDGQVVSQSDHASQCPYTNFLACPASESGAINPNSATVSDGQHSMALVVENAAQNSRTIDAATITTLNGQSGAALGTLPGPGTIGGLGGVQAASAGNGAVASHAAQLRLSPAHLITRSFSRSAVALGRRLLDGGGVRSLARHSMS